MVADPASKNHADLQVCIPDVARDRMPTWRAIAGYQERRLAGGLPKETETGTTVSTAKGLDEGCAVFDRVGLAGIAAEDGDVSAFSARFRSLMMSKPGESSARCAPNRRASHAPTQMTLARHLQVTRRRRLIWIRCGRVGLERGQVLLDQILVQ